MLGEEETLFHFSRAVLSLGSVDIADCQSHCHMKNPASAREIRDRIEGGEKDLNWRKTRISDHAYRFHKLHK